MGYGCHNHEPRAKTIVPLNVQNGWTPKGERIMELSYPKWQDIECGHITSHLDEGCDQCRWQRKQDLQ